MEFVEVIQYEAHQFILSLPLSLNMSIRKLLTSAAAFSGTVLSQSAAGVEDLDGPGTDLYDKDLSTCPGYIATNQHETRSGFYADLSLAGEACNVFGTDLPDLKLEVEYQTSERLHVKIKDSNNTVYQVSRSRTIEKTLTDCRLGPGPCLPPSRIRSVVLAQRLKVAVRFPGRPILVHRIAYRHWRSSLRYHRREAGLRKSVCLPQDSSPRRASSLWSR